MGKPHPRGQSDCEHCGGSRTQLCGTTVVECPWCKDQPAPWEGKPTYSQLTARIAALEAQLATREEPIVPVSQEHARGCSVACLAMITGQTYEQVASWFGDVDWNTKGIYISDVDCFLSHHGYAIARKYIHGRGGPKPREWPPKPFWQVHLCEVIVGKDSPCGHFVVMLADGGIIDPLAIHRIGSLRDYFNVNNVAAIRKLTPAEPPPAAEGGE